MHKGIFQNEQHDAGVPAALGRLDKVTAPTNFEANVRSAIQERSRRSFFEASGLAVGLKFALPALALVMLGAYFLFSTEGGTNDGQIARSETDAGSGALTAPTVAEHIEPPVTVPVNNTIAESGQTNVRIPANRAPRGDRAPANGTEFQGGSRDMALSQDNTALLPKGVVPDREVNSAPTSSPITAESILLKMGVSPKCVESGCAAAAIRSESLAERSGIKKGDLIEAIDGKPLRKGTAIEGNVVIRNVTVSREGKKLTITLDGK